MWDCSSRSQVFHAVFEVHEAAMKLGFMPDEATTLSLSLAELGTQAAAHGHGSHARVEFKDEGWMLEVRSGQGSAVGVANYERRDALGA